jgi:SAM-dependent methyltransferase
LGSAELLAQATDEVVGLLERWQLIDLRRDVLDLGCGIGRFLVALAPKVRSVLGLDISPGMVSEARRRTANLANVRVAVAKGDDLAGVADTSVDFILAADVMPYLVQAGGGLAGAHIREFGRALRPGGSVLILNWSYRGNTATDRADAVEACAAAGLDLTVAGERLLSLWDASAFLLKRPG